MVPAWSTNWQLLAKARYSKVCWVKESPGLGAATIPALPPRASVVGAHRILSHAVGAAAPAPGPAVRLYPAEAPLGKGLPPEGVDDGGSRIGVGDAVGRK